MACEAWQNKLDAYLDCELPETDARELRNHLFSCTDCSHQALARSELKRTIHTAGKRFVPTPDFRRRLQTSISPRRADHRWAWIFASAAAFAAILLVTFGAIFWVRQAHSRQFLSEVADLHVTSLASTNRVDVASSDMHTVKPWFQGKLPFTFNLPELQGSPFELVGGKLIYLSQEPAAELLFSVRKHLLSVFVLKDSTDLDRAFGDGTPLRKVSFNMSSWADGSLRYIIITDASPRDVEELRALFTLSAR